MRLREILLAASLIFGGAGLTACDQNKTSTEKPTAESPDKKEGEEPKDGAAKKPTMDADKKDGDGGDAAADSKLPFEATGPVAVVDGNEISAEKYNEMVDKLVRVMGGRMPPRMVHFYKKQMLNRVVDEHLLDKQVKAKKIEVSDEDLKKEYDKFVARFPSKEQFELYFKRSKMSEDELKADMRKRIGHEKLLIDKYGIEVKPEEVKDFYDKNIKRFQQEEQVKASHILLKVPKDADDAKVKEIEKQAAELTKKARAKDADFAALAKEHSEGPSGPRGGNLGLFPRKRMVKPFSDAAFDLKVGEVSDPVRTQFGFHVIKVFEKKPAQTQPFDEVKDMIEYQLFSKRVREGMNKLLAEIKKDVKIELKEDNIKVNVKAPKGNPSPFGMPYHGGKPGAQGGHGHAHGSGADHSHGGKKVAPKPKVNAIPKGKIKAPSKIKLPTKAKGE